MRVCQCADHQISEITAALVPLAAFKLKDLVNNITLFVTQIVQMFVLWF